MMILLDAKRVEVLALIKAVCFHQCAVYFVQLKSNHLTIGFLFFFEKVQP